MMMAAPRLKRLPRSSEDISAFFGVSIPPISTAHYVARLVNYAHSSPSTFVVMLILVRRVGRLKSGMQVNRYNMHRIAITALMAACKMLDDRVFSCSHYARVGGVPSAREMSSLELLFMGFLRYSLFVGDDEYNDMCAALARAAQRGAARFTDVGSVSVGSSFVSTDDSSFVGTRSGRGVKRAHESDDAMET